MQDISIQLRKQLVCLKKDEEDRETLSAYIARARSLNEQLAAAGEGLEEKDLVSIVLAGLPHDFSVIQTLLENTDKELTLDEVLAKLLPVQQRANEQEGRVYDDPYAKQKALSARQSDHRCWNCNQPGHIRRNCLTTRAEMERNRLKQEGLQASREGKVHPRFGCL